MVVSKCFYLTHVLRAGALNRPNEIPSEISRGDGYVKELILQSFIEF